MSLRLRIGLDSTFYAVLFLLLSNLAKATERPNVVLILACFVSNLHKPLNPMAKVNCRLSKLLFKYES